MNGLTLAPLSNVDIGAAISAAIALIAFRTKSLDGVGACAAVVVGTCVFGALGLPGAAVLLVFFVSSVALSRVGRARKRALLADIGKTSARDGAQVLANGGIAAACALLAHVDVRFAYAFAGALAAANADTWGTEIGTLVRGAPRSILTLRPMATGLSGGITLAGSLAEICGALVIGSIALALGPGALLPVTCGGVAGALADSVLGASLQTLRWCDNCRVPTETEPHRCGANTRRVRGVPWLGNDAVNLLATAIGAATAFAVAR